MGFRVLGFGFRAWFKVYGLGFRCSFRFWLGVWALGSRPKYLIPWELQAFSIIRSCRNIVSTVVLPPSWTQGLCKCIEMYVHKCVVCKYEDIPMDRLGYVSYFGIVPCRFQLHGLRKTEGGKGSMTELFICLLQHPVPRMAGFCKEEFLPVPVLRV